jgi:hypothetical protein
MAVSLRKEGFDVALLDGDQGEFTISVDGKTVFKKGDSLPSPNDVLAAVKGLAKAS